MAPVEVQAVLLTAGSSADECSSRLALFDGGVPPARDSFTEPAV